MKKPSSILFHFCYYDLNNPSKISTRKPDDEILEAIIIIRLTCSTHFSNLTHVVLSQKLTRRIARKTN